MKIIIDSNILFSALIKDSLTRKIIFEYRDRFLFPSFIFQEMKKHKGELLKKSMMSNYEFNKLLELILKKVIIIPEKKIIAYKKKAIEMLKDIDLNDVIFVCCALAYPESIIWSDDKNLKKLSKVRIMNTKEIIELILP